jgi:hypothetical protein
MFVAGQLAVYLSDFAVDEILTSVTQPNGLGILHRCKPSLQAHQFLFPSLGQSDLWDSSSLCPVRFPTPVYLQASCTTAFQMIERLMATCN